MLLVANLFPHKMMQKSLKNTEALAYGYSSERLSNEYANMTRFSCFSENLCKVCILVLRKKVGLTALKELKRSIIAGVLFRAR